VEETKNTVQGTAPKNFELKKFGRFLAEREKLCMHCLCTDCGSLETQKHGDSDNRTNHVCISHDKSGFTREPFWHLDNNFA